MLDYKNLTFKQINTLLDFAKGYSIIKIATKHNVCKNTITNRLKRISNKAPDEFDKAVGIRRAYKRAYMNLQNPISLEDCSENYNEGYNYE